MHRERLRTSFFPSALKISMLLHPTLRNVGMNILYDLIWFEYQSTKSFAYVTTRGSTTNKQKSCKCIARVAHGPPARLPAR